MIRTKKESEKRRKKLVRTGSKSFMAGLSRGETVCVTQKNWIDYWASVQDPNRERYQAELEKKNREIEYLEGQLYASRLFRARVDTKLTQEQEKSGRLEREHEEHLAKISQLESLLVVVLTPWAYSLGPRKLMAFIDEQKTALDIEVSSEVCNEVILAVFSLVTFFLGLDKSGRLNTAHNILMKKIDKVG